MLKLAADQASRQGSATVEPEHLLFALVSTPGHAQQALQQIGIQTTAMQAQLPSSMAPQPVDTPRESGALDRVKHYAWKESQHLGHRQIDAVHLLLGLLYEDSGRAIELLREHNLSIYDLRAQIMAKPSKLVVPLRKPLRAVVRPSPLFLGFLAFAVGSAAWLFFGPPEKLVQPLTVVFILCGYVVSLCIHEFGHALAAYLGGDASVVDKGYLTLDPRHYTHPVLSLLLPLVFLLLGGFGLPGGAVYINRRALRNPRWESLVSAAGPLGTLVCFALLSWPFYFDWYNWVSDQNYYFWPALGLLAFLQVTGLVFNLLPIPSLDGFGILAPWIRPDPRVYQFGQILVFLMFYILLHDSPLSAAFWDNMYGIADILHLPGDVVGSGWDQFYGR